MENGVNEEKRNSVSIAKDVTVEDRYFFQYVVAFSASLLLFSSGISFAWTSPAIPQLMDGGSTPFQITSDEGSWIVAVYVIGTILVPLPAAYMMDRFGRKKTLLAGAIPLIIGWILVGVSKSISMIYVSRVFCGFSFGLSYSVLPMYLAEIASDKIRGSITIILTVMAKCGILFAYVVGTYNPLHTSAWISIAPAIIFMSSFIWLPDSPYYLIGKKREKEAIRSLERLRGHSNVQAEYERMCITVRKSEENKGAMKEIMSRNNIRASIIIMGLGGIQQFCGSQAVISYAQIIFDNVGSDLGGAESTFILAVVQIIASGLSSLIVDRFGRRPLLMFSVSGAAVCNTIVGVYFFLEYQGNDVRPISWLPMTAIMVFVVSFTLGLATVTFVILGEVFPKNLRAAAGAVFTIFASICSFGVAKMFQGVSDNVGSFATFWIFAGFCYLFIPFICLQSYSSRKTGSRMENGKEKRNSVSIAKEVAVEDRYFFQYVVAFSASLLLFSSAISFGWTSPAIPQLMDGGSTPFQITSDEGSWIVAVYVIGTILVPLPAAYMMDRFGRKKTLLAGAIPLIIGWILVGVSKSISMVYVSRVFCGFSYGLSYSVLPMYLAEIASDKIRGSITIILTVMAKCGILYSYVVGTYNPLHTSAWISMAPPILFMSSFIWLPDSPYYLIGKKREKEAIRSLERLRGHSNVQAEYERMCITVRKSEENKGAMKEIMSRNNIRASIIIMGLGGIQQFCGSQAVISYAQIIFDSVGSDLGGAESTFILAAVQIIASGLSSLIVDRFGRRPLLMFSVSGAAVCNTIVGVYFFLEYQGNDVRSLSWLPMTAIMVFIVSYTLGLATVTFVVLGEVFPKNLRAAAGAVFTIFASVCGFSVAKMFQGVSDNVGSFATFWIFAGFSYLFIPFIWFVIPETKNKPLDTILEELRIKKR
ncbi:Facilitated trehalose transporter Tret1 [Pseudolycoriella hygida]|uniref:Facilitated trehalose transporter Tret1 n=1 Tax=Pseudolycoriella hygida TaxID=35572 RepID=A0A9Q0S2C1_9DIPT|nr:Facilitated trehalose transporter Tret1 [Pseudolycoriella hygida]